jgi:tetratricopeptide (TPR) repeat protein
MRDRVESRPGARPGARAAARAWLLASLLLTLALPGMGGEARAQSFPTERPPDERDFGVAGQNSDYYAGDAATAGIIQQVERYHLSEDNFWRHYRDGHLEYARNELIFTLRWLPNHPRALYLMELICKQMGRPEMAIQYYEKAVRLFPHRAYTRAQYGAYLVRVGARETGIQELRAAVAADSTLLQARAWLSQALAPAPTTGGASSTAGRPAPAKRPDGGAGGGRGTRDTGAR